MGSCHSMRLLMPPVPPAGGFGGAPKFPRPAEINLLLTQHARLAAAGQTDAAGARHGGNEGMERWRQSWAACVRPHLPELLAHAPRPLQLALALTRTPQPRH